MISLYTEGMDILDSMPFPLEKWTGASGPLARFLPPVPDGPARAFSAQIGPPGNWLLDPFGASPRFAVELARAGQRVLVAAGNPVLRFLLDLTAQPPTLADLQAALSDLAAARKENERLETHIQSLYLTHCANCGHEVAAEAFLWDSRSGTMTGRIYNCLFCGHGGEQPTTSDDLERAAQWARSAGLHRARALERIAPGNDPDRPFAEEALTFYQPRAVYALGTLINRLDGISTTDERRRCMQALLLWACDACNSLWAHPSERPRPKQLSFPNIFRENNVWLALEAGVKAWATDEAPLPSALWPDEPPESGGIVIFEGPLRDLTPALSDIPLKAVSGTIPRPNQAFWTLSALWAGWLWGHEAVGPFKAVLRRRRYDWSWHAEALRALFSNLIEIASPETLFFAALAEAEPSFVTAAVLAARAAGFEVLKVSAHAESEPLQLLLQKPTKARPNKLPVDVNFVKKAIRTWLEQRGEPAPYLHIHAAALMALAGKGMLAWNEQTQASIEDAIHTALASDEFIDLEGRAVPETGTWGLKKWGQQESFQGME